MKEIRITCHAADLMPIDALIEFQGGLKQITRENLDKLKRSILRYGFSAPIFVWSSIDNYILDGHQRLKALIEFRQEGYDIPLIPVVYIDADNEDQAKEKLLYITSQYGDFMREGFNAFIEDLDFAVEDIRFMEGEFWTSGDAEERSKDGIAVDESYEVIVNCEDETDTQMFYERMVQEGRKCRISIL